MLSFIFYVYFLNNAYTLNIHANCSNKQGRSFEAITPVLISAVVLFSEMFQTKQQQKTSKFVYTICSIFIFW